MKKIYIAGFDVFRADAAEAGAYLKALCGRYGYEGLYPLDKEADDAGAIFAGNLRLIERCDILIANLNNFRGLEPDSGTAFELGYAYARGKQILGYLEDTRPLLEKLSSQEKYPGRDDWGYSVEDFGLPVNLMLGCAAEIVQGGFEDCLQRL